MEYIMNLIENKSTEYKALAFLFAFFRSLTKILGFSSPALFFLFSVGVGFWFCLVLTLIFVALMRIAWVYCDAKTRTYEIVCTELDKKKTQVMTDNFR